MAKSWHAPFCAIPALAILLSAQQPHPTLSGIVLENVPSGKGVDSAQISADPPGSPRQTKSDGTFILEFPQSRPGNHVTVKLEKQDPENGEDYVVVNDVQLSTNLPTDPNYKVTLIICKKGDREDYARLFYKLKSREQIERISKAQIAELVAQKNEISRRLQDEKNTNSAEREEWQRKLQEKDLEIAALNQRTLHAEAAAQSASEAIADGTAGKNLENYKAAMKLILDGDIDAGLKLLDNQAISKQADEANKKISGGEVELQQAVDQWHLEAAARVTQLRIDDAEAVYKMAASKASLNFKANYYYAGFELSLHSHDNAIAGFERSRKLADLKEDHQGVGLALTGIGNTYADKGDYDSAIPQFRDALKAFESLAPMNPVLCDQFRVGALVNLGIALRRQRKLAEAKTQFNKAAEILQTLPNPGSPRNLSLFAVIHLDTGNIHLDQGNITAAYQEYSAATSTFERLVKDDPTSYQPELAQAWNNLGEMERELIGRTNRDQQAGLMADSEKRLEAARAVRRGLADANPRAYRPDYAQTLTNLGLLYSSEGQFSKAEAALVEARTVRSELVRDSPGVYENVYANTLTTLGSLYGQEYERSQHSRPDLIRSSIENLTEAVNLLERVSKADPARDQAPLAKSLGTLGRAYQAANQLDDALTTCKKANAIYKTLDPFRVRYEAFVTLRNIGYLEFHAGHQDKAVNAFEDAMTYVDKFSKDEKFVYEREILDVAGTLAALQADSPKQSSPPEPPK